jgi:hypothetical protein
MLHERERGCFTRFLQKMSKRSQVITTLLDRNLADLFQLLIRIMMCERNKADEHPHARNAPFRQHRLCPEVAPRTDEPGSPKMIFRSPFHAGDLFLRNMLRIGAEASRFELAVNGDLFHLAIEDADEFAVVANPYFMPQVLRRHGIIGFFHLDVSVSMNRAFAFLKEGKETRGQRQKSRSFLLLEELFHLLAGCSVNPKIGDVRFPPAQIRILGSESLKRSSL